MISPPLFRMGVVSFAIVLWVPVAVGQVSKDPATMLASATESTNMAASPRTPRIPMEMRGDIYMARKMYREAIDAYRACPTTAVIDNKIGIAFHQLVQLNLAEKYYKAAMKLDPKYAEAINNAGTIYYSWGNYRKALKFYKKALKYQPDTATLWVNLGSAYFEKRDMKRATEAYGRAMQLDPQVFEHHSQYGTLLQEHSTADRGELHLCLAKLYAKRGDKAEALLYLRKALEEGIKERNKILDIPEFALLKQDAGFADLMAENPHPL